ncbi:MAG: hypothetical protein ACP5NY_08225 [Thermocladium sp.]
MSDSYIEGMLRGDIAPFMRHINAQLHVGSRWGSDYDYELSKLAPRLTALIDDVANAYCVNGRSAGVNEFFSGSECISLIGGELRDILSSPRDDSYWQRRAMIALMLVSRGVGVATIIALPTQLLVTLLSSAARSGLQLRLDTATALERMANLLSVIYAEAIVHLMSEASGSSMNIFIQLMRSFWTSRSK